MQEIEELECGIENLDFADVAKLLDFYGAQLDMNIRCFSGLPIERFGKCFDERYTFGDE